MTMRQTSGETMNKGSQWLKWDLHIHTPASFHWNGGPRLGQLDAAGRTRFWEAAFAAMVSSGVSVFGIQDYFTFDGYRSMIVDGHRPEGCPLVLPGIELRVEAPVDFRLNFHVLFSDAVGLDRLEEFKHALALSGSERAPTPTNLMAFARALDAGKLRHHGFKPEEREDDEKMLRLGYMTATVSLSSVRDALTKKYRRDEYLVIQPYDTSDGLSGLNWKEHAAADATFFRFADMFEVRKPDNVDLFLGRRTERNGSYLADFIECLGGRPKPVCSGSDAHRIDDYGVYPSDRITWIRARPTFRGLQQCLAEPLLRTHIGLEPAKLTSMRTHPTRYAKSIAVGPVSGSNAEGWFDSRLELNEGLVAIIGNKGSGKSALADIIARCGNAHRNGYAFLVRERFRHPPNPSKNFQATLEWHDGHRDSAQLSTDPDSTAPEKVHYLPQQHVERLCNGIADGTSSFENEIKQVVFGHTDISARLGAESLDELVDLRCREFASAGGRTIERIRALSSQIQLLRDETGAENLQRLRNLRGEKEREVEAHRQIRPQEVPEPDSIEISAESKELKRTLAKLKAEFEELASATGQSRALLAAGVASVSACHRLRKGILDLEADTRRQLWELRADAATAGLELDTLLSVHVDVQPLDAALARHSLAVDAARVQLAAPETGLVALHAAVQSNIEVHQNQLSAPARKREQYLSQLSDWNARLDELVGTVDLPQTLCWMEEKERRAKDIAPGELRAASSQRIELVKSLHQTLMQKRDLLVELFKPVDAMIAGNGLTDLPLEFKARVHLRSFQERFLSFIHQRKRGPFAGIVEGRQAVDELLAGRDWSLAEDVVAFLDELTNAMGDSQGRAEQMAAGRTIADLEDFLFGLDYLEVGYTIELHGKSIETLSPGERGSLLIAFYLLLDVTGVPLIIDQPEENLDNETLYKVLVPCFQHARHHRQVIIVTHSPNLAIVSDADQIIRCTIVKHASNAIAYESFAIEDPEGSLNAVNVLEGTWPAFKTRSLRYGQFLEDR